MKKIITVIFLLLSGIYVNAQDELPTYSNLFLIDSYITPEEPHTFTLSFFTAESVKSTLVMDSEYEVEISEDYTADHKAEIEVSRFKFDSSFVPYYVKVENKKGEKFKSTTYTVELPQSVELKSDRESSLFTVCLFGGVIFGLPSPTYISAEGEYYFGLSKEIPVLTFQSMGRTYPLGYFDLEYQYIFDAPSNHFVRFGYKHLFELPVIEYAVPGLNFTTDFKGFNAASPEISLGLLRIYNAFTLYTKYRYNIKPGEINNDFHEISIGLYSSFFTINL